MAVLTACEQAAPPAPEPQAEQQAKAATVQPGLYTVGDDTTVCGTTRLSKDGTYVDYDENEEVVGGGTWRTAEDELCFDPEGDGDEERTLLDQ